MTGYIEEVIDDMVIWIEPDPDHFRGGYVWSVSLNQTELDCGLSYSPESARSDAEKVVFALLHRRSADFKTL
jgi:hypothetical protein